MPKEPNVSRVGNSVTILSLTFQSTLHQNAAKRLDLALPSTSPRAMASNTYFDVYHRSCTDRCHPYVAKASVVEQK